ncbi:MAG: tryptophan synthase subunit alpha [Opitutales bacterium]|nr:tryptophan synthase subunit alpha [Opitutales bacterium]
MIKQTFKNLKRQNRAALALFITCGDPDIKFTERLAEKISQCGADIIELGVPFSDPMADGATIQEASNRALASRTNVGMILDMVLRLRARGVKTPFVLFGYFNTFFQMGVDNLARRSKEAGVNAWLVADLPIEESGEVLPHLKANGLDLIALASPTTPLERIKKISKTGSGFLYYVTVAGVTGARDKLPEDFAKRLEEVRAASALPVGAGFGISNRESAHAAAKRADCVIVGSKIVDLLYKTRVQFGEDKAIDEACEFVKSLSSAMNRQ